MAGVCVTPPRVFATASRATAAVMDLGRAGLGVIVVSPGARGGCKVGVGGGGVPSYLSIIIFKLVYELS